MDTHRTIFALPEELEMIGIHIYPSQVSVTIIVIFLMRKVRLEVFCDLKMSLKKRKLKQAHKCENLPTVS